MPPAVAALSAELGIQANRPPAPLFRDWVDFTVNAIVHGSLPRTLVFGANGVSEALEKHALSGDFRLLKERYGCRPVYRRVAQVVGSPALDIFFEPRSGHWVIASGSPFATSPETPVGTPGLFGEVFARSGPAWSFATPEEATPWEFFEMEALRPEDLLEYHGRAPDVVLAPLFTLAPGQRLHPLRSEAPPQWLHVGGCGSRTQTVNGTYELLEEVHWSSRPAWQKVPSRLAGESGEFPKFLFFWPDTGHWILGSDMHSPTSAIARNGPSRWSAESPDQCTACWDALNGKIFVEDAHVYVRKQRSATGGLEPSGCPSPLGSPRHSRPGSPRLAFTRSPLMTPLVSPRPSPPQSPRQLTRCTGGAIAPAVRLEAARLEAGGLEAGSITSAPSELWRAAGDDVAGSRPAPRRSPGRQRQRGVSPPPSGAGTSVAWRAPSPSRSPAASPERPVARRVSPRRSTRDRSPLHWRS